MKRAVTVVLIASIIFAGAAVASVVTTPRPGARLTEFFILGPGERAEGYPTVLNISEEGTLIVGVANHEFEPVDYTVRADRIATEVVRNEMGGYNETVDVGSPTSLAWFNITLDHNSNWTTPFTFSIETAGLWKVRLLLFKDGNLGTAYRSVHLFVTVRAF